MIRWLLLALLLSAQARAAERIVSLNLCTDEMLVLLAPGKIAALSPLARDPSISVVAKQAARLPWVRPVAEAVLARRPDLVLAGRYGAQTTLAILAARGVPIYRAALPHDFAGIRAELLRLAAVLGATPRAREILADMDRRLAALPPPGAVRALAWGARGATAGPGSLDDAVLRAAGLTNIGHGREMGLEAVRRAHPDLLVVPAAAAYPSLATAMLDDPALADIPRRTVPAALTTCAGPWSAGAVEMLAK